MELVEFWERRSFQGTEGKDGVFLGGAPRMEGEELGGGKEGNSELDLTPLGIEVKTLINGRSNPSGQRSERKNRTAFISISKK